MSGGAGHRVFVYGTLRRGGCYHHLLGDAASLGEGLTAPHYELVDMGEYPAALEHGDTPIYGELYAVNDEMLSAIDALEEVPHYYRRIEIAVLGTSAYFYVLHAASEAAARPRIRSGRWTIPPRG